MSDMTMLELLALPGMDGAARVERMRRESEGRLMRAARSRRLAAALMSRPRHDGSGAADAGFAKPK